MKRKKKMYVVESCDSDERQAFCDVVPALNEQRAKEEVELFRGDYAVVMDAQPLAGVIKRAREGLKRLGKVRSGGVLKAQQAWDSFLGEEGGLVRMSGDRLGRLDEDVSRCAVCEKFYELGGESWFEDLDAECAKRVSDVMTNERVEREKAIKRLRARDKALARKQKKKKGRRASS